MKRALLSAAGIFAATMLGACAADTPVATAPATTSTSTSIPETTVPAENPVPARHGLSWQTIELAGPEGDLVGQVIDVAQTDNHIRVVGSARGPGLSGEVLLVWESTDGTSWELVTPEGITKPGGQDFLHLASGGAGYVAVSHEDFFAGEPVRVWTSRDAIEWHQAALPVELSDNDHYFVQGVVATEAGFLVHGRLITTRPDPTAGVTKDGLTLTLDIGWEVIDSDSGTTIDAGDLSDIYPTEVDPAGARVRDPASDEVLVVIPWDAYEAARVSTGVVTAEIEYEGWLIVEDESSNSYSVVDLASGQQIVTDANQNYLSLGPDPELLLADGRTFRVTWDELDDAWLQGIEEADAAPVEEGEAPGVFHSGSGSDWAAANFEPLADDATGVDVYWISPGPLGSGFLAAGATIIFDEADGVGHPSWTTWRSQDGTTWTPESVERHAGLLAETASTGPPGILVTGHNGQERYVASSSDGLAWTLDYVVDEPYLTEWMWDAAVGGWLSAAVGSSESPFGLVADLFIAFSDETWMPAVLPGDPLSLELTEVEITDDLLVLGGSWLNDRGLSAPALLVATATRR